MTACHGRHRECAAHPVEGPARETRSPPVRGVASRGSRGRAVRRRVPDPRCRRRRRTGTIVACHSSISPITSRSRRARRTSSRSTSCSGWPASCASSPCRDVSSVWRSRIRLRHAALARRPRRDAGLSRGIGAELFALASTIRWSPAGRCEMCRTTVGRVLSVEDGVAVVDSTGVNAEPCL